MANCVIIVPHHLIFEWVFSTAKQIAAINKKSPSVNADPMAL